MRAESLAKSIKMLKGILDGKTYVAVAQEAGLSRSAVEQRVKTLARELQTVVGVESVTVPAGTFDAYKVEVTSADGGSDKETLWIAKDSRKPVKLTAVLAQMGGAVLTEELQ